MPLRLYAAAALVAALAGPAPALAQRAQENAVDSATDGFGATVGNERVGVYTTTSVRGFSPITAGNRRIEGLYFDLGGNGLTNRLVARSTVRVGLPALAYPFPAPSGIVDYDLRKAGNEAVLSVVAGVPAYAGYSLEVDGQAPLAGGRLAVGGGLGLQRNTYVDGRETEARSIAVLPTVRLGEGELTTFLGVAQSGGSVPPILVTTGPSLPPVVDTSRFYSQAWIDNDQLSFTYGLTGRLPISDDLSLRLGVFESRSTRRRTFTDLFLDVQPDGAAQEVVLSDPRLPARWTSGEARLSWRLSQGRLDQTVHLALRARDKRLETGGSGSALLGPTLIGTFTPAPEPDFSYSSPTISHVRQASLGLAYIGRWSGGAELNLGLQKTDYAADFQNARGSARTHATPWLYNATLAYAPLDWLGFYGGVARGLEESAPAPPSAANRDDAVPASRTFQVDGGARVAFGGLRLVAGVFQLERPYYSVGADNQYRQLGQIRNRGVEISLAGPLSERLSAVAGLVLMDPSVLGDAFETGRTGHRPVGATTRSARIDLEYRMPVVDGLSLTLAVQHAAAVTASTAPYAELGGRQLEIPAATTIDIGGRYRFAVGDVPVTARVQVLNLFDVRRYAVSSSNAFGLPDVRRFTIQLSADF